MKRLRLYLDTSVVSQIDDSERGIITKQFFEIAERTGVELVISPIVQAEINEAKPEKQDMIMALIELLPLTKLNESTKAEMLAKQYVFAGILNENHIDDLNHIAYAVLSDCDYIVSWNMKHLANQRTILRVHKYNSENKIPKIIIVTPKQLINKGGLCETKSERTF
ncbi:MAG: hypothetical protein LBT09_12210 [Planctomycetaceae bacterium]|jgi:predicted nucleic acid-binding protein|nr:hypothetical protein [Planctomycetaceae bacterium]